MENIDVNGDSIEKKEQNLSASGNRGQADYEKFENVTLMEEMANLDSNDRFLQRKRESDRSADVIEGHTPGKSTPHSEGFSKKESSVCNLCKKKENDSCSTVKNCKTCNSLFHLDCLLATGECQFGGNFICISCKKQTALGSNNEEANKDAFNNMRNMNMMGSNPNLFGNYNFPQTMMQANPVNKGNQTQTNQWFSSNYGSYPMNYYNNFPQNMLNLLKQGQNPVQSSSSNLPNLNPQQLQLIQYIKQMQSMQKKDNNSNTATNSSDNLNFNLSHLNPLLSSINKQNSSNITNFNIINNLINCSNYNNINTSQGKLNKNILLNQMHAQLANSGNPNLALLRNSIGLGGGSSFTSQNMSGPSPNLTHKANIKNTSSVNSLPLNFPNSALFSQLLQNNLANSKLSSAGKSSLNPRKEDSQTAQVNQLQSNLQKLKKLQVEDMLLYKNPDKYEIDIENFERPEFAPLNIPNNLSNKVIIIWDFASTFTNSTLAALDIEKFYSNLISSDLFPEMVKQVLPIFINATSLRDYTDFSDDRELTTLKALKENINSDLTSILSRCWQTLLLIIFGSKRFSLVVTEDIISTCRKLIQSADSYSDSNSQSNITPEDKVNILYTLVTAAFEVPKIKETVQREIEKKNELVKEKNYLENEYRNKELRKREIEKSDKFLNAGNKIEALNKKLDDLETNKETINVNNYNKQKKELENERNRYRSLIKENEDLLVVKEKIINRLKIIKTEINDMKITSKRLLGQDLFKNEFYFFKFVKDRIYVKKYEIKEEKLNRKNFTWVCLNNQEDIQVYISRLLEKGIREKKLRRSLNKVLSKKMDFSENAGNAGKTGINAKEEENGKMIVESTEEIPGQVPEQVPEVNPTDLNPAVEIMKKLDDKFSDYLSQYNKEWETSEIRTKWRDIISAFPTLDNCIQSLSMINLRFKNPYRNDEPPVSENEDEDMEAMNNIKRPKFTFKNLSEDVLLTVYEFDQLKILAPKVKIWSKDLESNDVEKLFTEGMMSNIRTHSQFFLALHFFESILFSLIKRREPVKKNVNLMKEISDKDIANMNDLETVNAGNEEGAESNNVNIEDVEMNDDKTVSYTPDQMDVDKTETIVQSANTSEKKIKPDKANEIVPRKTAGRKKTDQKSEQKKDPCDVAAGLNKRKRTAAPKDLRAREWRETCYICDEYGDLICCDGCSNVAHKFCACLETIPDTWYCEKCVGREGKEQKNKKKVK